MEHTIGNLGQEIRQPSNPYANLAREGARRYKINALLTILPELECRPSRKSFTSVNLGGGFTLKSMREGTASLPTGQDARAILTYLESLGQKITPIRRWARLQLPNGQIARSAWRETLKKTNNLWVSRNVKVRSSLLF
jgi:hypothetical protein